MMREKFGQQQNPQVKNTQCQQSYRILWRQLIGTSRVLPKI